MKQSSYSEADSCSAGQESPGLMWNPKVHCPVHNPSLDRILNKFNPVLILNALGFDFIPGDQLSCSRPVVSFPTPSTQMMRQCLKVGSHRFLARPFQFVIHNHSSFRRQIRIIYADEKTTLNKLRINGRCLQFTFYVIC